MLKRLATAAVAIPLVVLLAAWVPPWGLLAVVVVVAVLGYWELCRLARAQSIELLPTIGLLGTALLAARPIFGESQHSAGLVTGVVLLVLGALLARRRPLVTALPTAGATLVGVLWLGWLSSYLVLLHGSAERGAALLLLLGAVWLGDSGAMWVGKTFGRRPLAPILSPKKTIEGLGGQMLFTVLGLATMQHILSDFLPVRMNKFELVAVGLLLAAAATVGDLVESAFKRGANVKDSGDLFPGHGGVLDRIDSLLFAAPVLYYCHAWLRFFL